MFILRRYTSEHNEVNESLGDSYNLVKKEINPEEFNRTYKIWAGVGEDLIEDNLVTDGIYMFIIYKDGREIIPLHKASTYYIMTENGKTFSNITYR